MHYLGFIGVPRRYYEIGDSAFISATRRTSERVHHDRGADRRRCPAGLPVQPGLEHPATARPPGGNPWRATTLEWQTPHTPPAHGNLGKELPVVYRWAYDYSVPGAKQDFIPQNLPPDQIEWESADAAQAHRAHAS